MSTPTTPPTVKILHTWDVTLVRETDETGPEVVNGQTLTVTRKVSKPVVTRMALKVPTRRELRQAELFYGKELNRFMSLGFLQRSIVVNKHVDLTGGVLSQTERTHAQKLTEKLISIEMDLARVATSADGTEQKAALQSKLAAIRSELIDLNAANEAAFAHTAEAKAQAQLSTWFALFLVQIERAGKWQAYFEGETYEQREEFMWVLEEKDDEFYKVASDKIASYVYWFNKGADTPEAFKAMDDEMARQLVARKEAEASAKEEADKLAETEGTPAPASVGDALPATEPVAA